MLFSNPVRGPIHGAGWKRPAGNHEPAFVRGFSPTHDGIDVSFQRVGDPILAAAAGKVYFVGRDPAGSLYVCIDHGERRTLYGHLNDETVKDGQQVAAGALIGHCGYSGHTIPAGPGGAHLHFEVFDAATKRYDPWPLLAQNVTVHLDASDGVNVRSTAGSGTTKGPLYASTKGGRLIRTDGIDLGPSSAPRRWAGTVTGASYPAGSTYPAGNRWETLEVDAHWRYVASPLAVVSQR